MSGYSLKIISDEIGECEPLQSMHEYPDLQITSIGFRAPMVYDSYLKTVYARSKVFRADVILFRDDLPKHVLFDYVMALKQATKRNQDTWWGILTCAFSEKEREAWAKIGCHYYGSATDKAGLAAFLRTLTAKQANHVRYSRSSKVVT